MNKVTGVVKWFSKVRNFGFIVDEHGEDIFVHYTAIVAEGYKSLKENQKVTFFVSDTPKGKIATDVVAID